MWRSLSWPVLGLVLAAGLGCNSPLEEYVCTSSADCASGFDTGLSRCEPSGHCSFLDPSCLQSGFRFGEAAGSETGVCVGATGPFPDGGPGELRPVAIIANADLGQCRTNLLVDGGDSMAFGGATLTSFAWTLRDGNDEVVEVFAGPPGAGVFPGTHHRGGTFARPNVNFPAYHGTDALQAGIDGILRTSIFQRGIDLAQTPPTAKFRLYFTVGVELGESSPEEREGIARLTTVSGDKVFEAPFQLLVDRFVGYQFDFSKDDLLGPTVGASDLDKLTLSIQFAGTGVRWLDNVAIANLDIATLHTVNDSSEDTLPAPWLLGDGIADLSGLVARDIANVLEKEEFYTLSLQVTDSNGQRSEEDELSVFVDVCP